MKKIHFLLFMIIIFSLFTVYGCVTRQIIKYQCRDGITIVDDIASCPSLSAIDKNNFQSNIEVDQADGICVLSPGFACGEFAVFKVVRDDLDTRIIIIIKNGFGKNVNILDVDLAGAYGGYGCKPVIESTIIKSGGSQEFRFACAFIDDVGDDFRGDLTLTYKLEGESLSHTVTGLIKIRIE